MGNNSGAGLGFLILIAYLVLSYVHFGVIGLVGGVVLLFLASMFGILGFLWLLFATLVMLLMFFGVVDIPLPALGGA